MNRTYKAHPLLILRFLRPFLVVLILPFLKGAVEYLLYRKVTGVLTLEIILFLSILLLAFLQYRAFSVTVENDKITVNRGFLIKFCSYLPKNSISAVSVETSPLDLLFKSATIRINTEAGNKNTNDFIFKLSKRDASELQNALYGKEKCEEIRFSPFKVAITSAATSSATRGILIAVPVMNYANRLLGVAVSEMLFDELNSAGNRFNTYFPPTVNIITLIFLFFYGISFLNSLFRYMGFKLETGRDTVRTQAGLIIRKTAVFKKQSINNICIEQGPIMRFFGSCVMRASLGGYGSAKGSRAIIVPAGRHSEIKERFAAHFLLLGIKTPPLRAARNTRSLWRFLFVPRLSAVIALGVAALIVVFAPDFTKLVLFITLVALAIIAYYGNLCYLDYRFGAISFGDNIFAESSYKLTRRELYCKKEQIGVIKISQTPVDRLYKTCKIKITVRSESAESVRVKNIGIAATEEKIFGVYGIKF